MANFEVTNFTTWENASITTQFVWNGSSIFNEETGKNITEYEFVEFLHNILDLIKQNTSEDNLKKTKLPDIITFIIDLLCVGINANNVLWIIVTGIQSGTDFTWELFSYAKQVKESEIKKFDVYDMDSWRFATDNSLIWEGKSFSISEDKIFSEITFVKIMRSLYYDFQINFRQHPSILKIIIPILLEGFRQDEKLGDVLSRITEQMSNKIVQLSQNSVASTSTNNNYSRFRTQIDDDVNNKNIRTDYIIPPSKIPLILGIGLLIGGFIAFFSFIVRGNYDDFTKIIISIVVIICSLPFFIKYSSEKSKYFYKVVIAEMSQWVGRSSNDLIIKWGAPTKTYKFPGDKTMTVLEYKDSIRNYAGYRYKGMYMGQSKTTKYIKSFFVKDNVIVNFKYDIT